MKIDRHLGSSSAEMPVKYQSDTIIITPNLETLRDLAVRCLIAQWIEAMGLSATQKGNHYKLRNNGTWLLHSLLLEIKGNKPEKQHSVNMSQSCSNSPCMNRLLDGVFPMWYVYAIYHDAIIWMHQECCLKPCTYFCKSFQPQATLLLTAFLSRSLHKCYERHRGRFNNW